MQMPLVIFLVFAILGVNGKALALEPLIDFNDLMTLPMTDLFDDEGDSSSQQHISFFVKNECHVSAQVAVHYLAIDGQWKTSSWELLDQNQMVHIADSENRLFYVYAEGLGQNQDMKWDGEEFYGTVGGNEKIHGFFSLDAGEDWTNYIFRLTCK